MVENDLACNGEKPEPLLFWIIEGGAIARLATKTRDWESGSVFIKL